MPFIRNLVAGALIAGASIGAFAQSAAEHEKHHPAAMPAMGAMMADMDRHMQAMAEWRAKMAAAATPEAREALMAEHRRLMEQGMVMMRTMRDGMGGGMGMGGMGGTGPRGMGAQGMGDRQQMLEKRMDMMESMLQMMADRMPAPSAR